MILSGRIDASSGGLRVAAQLRNAQDGSVLWAEDMTDLNAGNLQPALANGIFGGGSIVWPFAAATACPSRATRINERSSIRSIPARAGRDVKQHGGCERASSRAAGLFETAGRLDPGFAMRGQDWRVPSRRSTFRGNAGRSLLPRQYKMLTVHSPSTPKTLSPTRP